MLYIGPGSDEVTDEHEGFVAGRYRIGAVSDIWTDVTDCAEGTFTAYVARCECGWSGSSHRVCPAGYRAAQRGWIDAHFRAVLAAHTAGALPAVPPGVPLPASAFLMGVPLGVR
jgi:hypothetical protein